MNNLESVNYYEIHWEDEANMCGTYGEPVAMTKSELWEYMEHLHQDELYFQSSTNEPLTTFTAVEISEKAYMESRGPFEADVDEEDDGELEWDRIDDVIDDYIGSNIIDLFGFLDRQKVRFSMWEDIIEANDNIASVCDLFEAEAIKEKCIIRVEGWFGRHKFYTFPIENPTWFQVVMAAELGIRESGDTDHCFMECVFKTPEIKDGLPVYQIALGS